MKTLYHIIRPDCGTVCLLGECVAGGNSPVFSRIGSIIESPVFYNHLSAYDNLELHCRYMGAGHENIGETLSLLGLSETGNKPVGKFSLGMKHRRRANEQVRNHTLSVFYQKFNVAFTISTERLLNIVFLVVI